MSVNPTGVGSFRRSDSEPSTFGPDFLPRIPLMDTDEERNEIIKFQLISVIIRALRGMYPLGDIWGQDGTASRNDSWVSSKSEFTGESIHRCTGQRKTLKGMHPFQVLHRCNGLSQSIVEERTGSSTCAERRFV
jgi:hypothetical protein